MKKVENKINNRSNNKYKILLMKGALYRTMTKMNYRVHHLEIKGKDIQNNLEKFLNDLEGDVVSILPAIKKDSLPQIYGITERVDFLMIVEKI